MTVLNLKDDVSEKEIEFAQKLQKPLTNQNFKDKAQKTFESISTNDSSRACLLPNGNLTVSNSYDDFDANAGKDRFKCMIPFKYENDNMFNSSKRIFVRNEIDSSKLYLTDIMNLDPSDEDFKNNSGKPLSKHIGKTLVGYDKQGIHYWLSRMNESKKIPDEIDIPPDSWLHIHVCEECLKRLNFQCNLHQSASTMYFPEIMECLSCNTNQFFSHGEPENYMSHDINSDSEQDETDREGTKCSEQYFRRVVYCTNTCALNFKFPEENFGSNRAKLKCPNLNPFMRVVVYGTDPCGLNFPVDLETVELNDLSNEVFLKPVECKKDSSLYKSCSEFFSGESGDMEVNGDRFCRLEPLENKHMISNKLFSPRSFQYNHGDSSNYSDSKTSSLTSINVFSRSESGNDNSTIALSTHERKDINKQVIHNINFSLIDQKNYKKSVSYFTSDSKTSTDFMDGYNDEILSPHIKIPAVRPLSSDLNSLLLYPKNTTRRRKIYHANYPQCGKVLEFLVYDKSKSVSFKRKPRSLCLRSGRRQIKKRRIAPLFLHFPDSSAMKVRMITIGQHYNRIFVQEGTDKNIEKSTTLKIGNHSIALQVFLYVFFILVFFAVLILIEDIWTHFRSSPPPKYDWYNQY